MPSVRAGARALHVDGPQDVGAAQQVGGGAEELDLALLHEDRLLGQVQGHVDRLLDHDDRDALGVDATHDLEQLADHRRREAQRELVDHQELGLREEGLGQRQLLLLAAREVAGHGVDPLGQGGEDGEYLGEASGRVDLGLVALLEDPRAEQDVLPHRELPGTRRGPGHRDHAPQGDLVGRHVGDVAAVEHDGAAGRLLDAADGPQQRRLARAVGAQQGDDLALLDVEVDAEQHLHAVVFDVDVAAHEQLAAPPAWLAATPRWLPPTTWPIACRTRRTRPAGGDEGADEPGPAPRRGRAWCSPTWRG